MKRTFLALMAAGLLAVNSGCGCLNALCGHGSRCNDGSGHCNSCGGGCGSGQCNTGCPNGQCNGAPTQAQRQNMAPGMYSADPRMQPGVQQAGYADPSVQQAGFHGGEAGGGGGVFHHGAPPAMGGPQTGAVTYPYNTNRGPRDFLAKEPTAIGP